MINPARRLPLRHANPDVRRSSLPRTYFSVLLSLLIALVLGMISYGYGADNELAQLLLGISLFCFSIILVTSITTRSGMVMTLFGIYCIFFLAFPGMLHAARNKFPFYSMSYNPDDILDAAIVVLAFAVGSLAGFVLATRGFKEPTEAELTPARQGLQRQTVATTSALGIVAMMAGSGVLILAIGPEIFLARRAELGEFAQMRNELTITLIAVARTLAIVALVSSAHRMKLGRQPVLVTFLFLATIALNAIANFPLAIARFTLFGSLLILSYLLFDVTRPRFKATLTISMVVLMGTVFPFISHLQKSRLLTSFDFDFINYFVESNDLDGFQSIVNVVVLINGTGYRLGWQLLSALFAVVPRSVWPAKGLPTGTEAADYAGYAMVNISSPLPSELLVDFGVFGVLAGAVLFTYLLTKSDQIYVLSRDRANLRSIFVFGGIAGYIVIVLRGALLGIIAPIALYFILTFILTAPPFKRVVTLRR
jgi:lipid-A-disaccharide synthase-like uncharacterized protein